MVTRTSRIRRLLIFAASFYVFTIAILVISETHLVYQPFDGPSEPAKAGLPHFTAKTLDVEGLPTILYWENAPSTQAPSVFYFHGNGGGLFMQTAVPDFLDKAGLHVVAIEYPSYPGAQGTPSEPVIIAQALALWDAKVTKSAQHPPAIWGYSLGSGVASQVAAKRQSSAVILEAPFTAVVDRAAELYPIFPVRYLVRNTYRSRDYIAHINAPLLILHGDEDIIIPIHHGRELFALAREPKNFSEYKGFGHLDLMDSPAYDDALAFIRRHTQ
jgi:pimeloyl-ACP methyl ester carboxylesterase